MAKIDENSIAKLKALFQDNEKALGSNFSQLIDFFNDNKVTDNGDGTFSVGNTIINVNDIVQEPEVRSIILSQLKASPDFATKSDVTTAVSAATANKQDKIGYTPADDSKVVHDNHDGTEQLNGVQVQPFNKLSDSVGGRNLLPGTSGTLQTVTNASGWNANLPTIIPVVATIDSDTTYTAREWISSASHDIKIQLAWTDARGNKLLYAGNVISAGTSGYSTWKGTITAGSTFRYVTTVFTASQSTPSSVSYKEMKLEQGSIATDWTPAPEDKVNVSDMRKPASDVAGIEEVNAKQDKIGYTPANDSKVAHLSGANNFDTVPTVNNNPLLLASSLPSDLARTGQANTFSKQQIFSTNPTNGTQVYPIYATVGTDSDATTLIASLQSSGFSGMIGVPES